MPEEPSAEESARKLIEMARALQKLRPALEEANNQMSLMYFQRFNSLVKAGFSEAQALTIVSARGLS